MYFLTLHRTFEQNFAVHFGTFSDKVHYIKNVYIQGSCYMSYMTMM
jgi:hypothetical protein